MPYLRAGTLNCGTVDIYTAESFYFLRVLWNQTILELMIFLSLLPGCAPSHLALYRIMYMYMLLCIYICVCVYVLCVCVCIYRCMCIYIYARVYMCKCISVFICVYVYVAGGSSVRCVVECYQCCSLCLLDPRATLSPNLRQPLCLQT